jgi:hypothetical protein
MRIRALALLLLITSNIACGPRRGGLFGDEFLLAQERVLGLAGSIRRCAGEPAKLEGTSIVIGTMVPSHPHPQCREVGIDGERPSCALDCGWEYELRSLGANERLILSGAGNFFGWGYECEFYTTEFPGTYRVEGEVVTSTHTAHRIIHVRELCRLE